MVFVGPFRFYDFGRPIRDLLYKDYFTQRKFTMSTYSADGVAITSSATKYGTAVDAQVKLRNVTADVKVDSDSKFIISTLFDDLAPGLNAIFTFYGHHRSGSLEVQSIDEHVRVYASIPMTANPTLCASGVVTSGMMGNTQVAVGVMHTMRELAIPNLILMLW